MPYSVVLIDDHQIMRDGIKAILEHNGEFQVAGEADNGADGVQVARDIRPDIVLMDIGMPGLNGIDATAELLRHLPAARVLILSMHEDEHTVVSAIRAGARAFVVKRAASNDLLDAMRTVVRGGSYLSPQVSDQLLRRIQKGGLEAKSAPSGLDMLSPRELQVMRLIAEGRTSKEIAGLLGLGEHTVRSYRKTLMKKLGVNNVAGLTHFALSSGLTRLPGTSESF
jgi:DNA-binding NarL/FixJ family response regulator